MTSSHCDRTPRGRVSNVGGIGVAPMPPTILMISSPIPHDQAPRIGPMRQRGRALRAAAVFLGVALAFVACNDVVAPLPQAGAPDVLEFSIGGFGGGGSAVLLRGDTVIMWRTPPVWTANMVIDSARVVPTQDAWRAFWSATKHAGVDQWRAQYNANGIVDGLGWNMRIVAGGRQINSFGSNAYPDRFGRQHDGDVTDEFQAFVTALGDLTGQRVWF